MDDFNFPSLYGSVGKEWPSKLAANSSSDGGAFAKNGHSWKASQQRMLGLSTLNYLKHFIETNSCTSCPFHDAQSSPSESIGPLSNLVRKNLIEIINNNNNTNFHEDKSFDSNKRSPATRSPLNRGQESSESQAADRKLRKRRKRSGTTLDGESVKKKLQEIKENELQLNKEKPNTLNVTIDEIIEVDGSVLSTSTLVYEANNLLQHSFSSNLDCISADGLFTVDEESREEYNKENMANSILNSEMCNITPVDALELLELCQSPLMFDNVPSAEYDTETKSSYIASSLVNDVLNIDNMIKSALHRVALSVDSDRQVSNDETGKSSLLDPEICPMATESVCLQSIASEIADSGGVLGRLFSDSNIESQLIGIESQSEIVASMSKCLPESTGFDVDCTNAADLQSTDSIASLKKVLNDITDIEKLSNELLHGTSQSNDINMTFFQKAADDHLTCLAKLDKEMCKAIQERALTGLPCPEECEIDLSLTAEEANMPDAVMAVLDNISAKETSHSDYSDVPLPFSENDELINTPDKKNSFPSSAEDLFCETSNLDTVHVSSTKEVSAQSNINCSDDGIAGNDTPDNSIEDDVSTTSSIEPSLNKSVRPIRASLNQTTEQLLTSTGHRQLGTSGENVPKGKTLSLPKEVCNIGLKELKSQTKCDVSPAKSRSVSKLKKNNKHRTICASDDNGISRTKHTLDHRKNQSKEVTLEVNDRLPTLDEILQDLRKEGQRIKCQQTVEDFKNSEPTTDAPQDRTEVYHMLSDMTEEVKLLDSYSLMSPTIKIFDSNSGFKYYTLDTVEETWPSVLIGDKKLMGKELRKKTFSDFLFFLENRTFLQLKEKSINQKNALSLQAFLWKLMSVHTSVGIVSQCQTTIMSLLSRFQARFFPSIYEVLHILINSGFQGDYCPLPHMYKKSLKDLNVELKPSKCIREKRKDGVECSKKQAILRNLGFVLETIASAIGTLDNLNLPSDALSHLVLISAWIACDEQINESSVKWSLIKCINNALSQISSEDWPEKLKYLTREFMSLGNEFLSSGVCLERIIHLTSLLHMSPRGTQLKKAVSFNALHNSFGLEYDYQSVISAEQVLFFLQSRELHVIDDYSQLYNILVLVEQSIGRVPNSPENEKTVEKLIVYFKTLSSNVKEVMYLDKRPLVRSLLVQMQTKLQIITECHDSQSRFLFKSSKQAATQS